MTGPMLRDELERLLADVETDLPALARASAERGRSMRLRRRALVGVGAVAAAAVVWAAMPGGMVARDSSSPPAATGDSPSPAALPGATDPAYFFAQAQSKLALYDPLWMPRTLAEALPNHQIPPDVLSGLSDQGAGGDQPAVPASSALVIGRVVDVIDGKGWQYGGGENGREVPLGPTMDYGSIGLVVAVDRATVSEDTPLPEGKLTVSVRVGPDDDLDRLRASAKSLGEIVVVLQYTSETNDDLTWRIADGEILLGTVVDGQVEFGAIRTADGSVDTEFLGGLTTPDAIFAEASRPFPAS